MSGDQVDDFAEPAALPLFGMDEIPTGGKGRYERALDHSIEKSSHLVDEDVAMIGAARAGAWALDQAGTGSGPKATYAVAAVLSAYREVLQALGLSPNRGDTPATGAAAFLADLGPTPPS